MEGYVLAQKREVATQKQVKIPADIHLYHFCNLDWAALHFFFFMCAKPILQIELPCFSFLQKSQGLKNICSFYLDKAAFTGSNTTKFLISILQFFWPVRLFWQIRLYFTFSPGAKPTPQIELLQCSSFLQKSQGLNICSF